MTGKATTKPRKVTRLPVPEGVGKKMASQIATSEALAKEEWLEQAREAIRRTADKGLPFSANDVWDNGLEKPDWKNGGRALGSQLVRMAGEREGYYIRRTNSVIRSKRGVAYIDVWVKS